MLRRRTDSWTIFCLCVSPALCSCVRPEVLGNGSSLYSAPQILGPSARIQVKSNVQNCLKTSKTSKNIQKSFFENIQKRQKTSTTSDLSNTIHARGLCHCGRHSFGLAPVDSQPEHVLTDCPEYFWAHSQRPSSICGPEPTKRRSGLRRRPAGRRGRNRVAGS